MGVDFSAYLIYGVALNDEEVSKVNEIRYHDDDGEIYIYDSIQEELDRNDLYLLENNCYDEPDVYVLGKEIKVTQYADDIKREDFFCIGPELILKINKIYKEIFEKDLDTSRLNLALLERIW